MADEKPSLSIGVQLQPKPTLIPNQPAGSVSQALANSAAQVAKAK